MENNLNQNNTEHRTKNTGKSEVERLICNNSKIIENTNWKPKYTLEQGLLETIDFLKNNLHYYKPEIYTTKIGFRIRKPIRLLYTNKIS